MAAARACRSQKVSVTTFASRFAAAPLFISAQREPRAEIAAQNFLL